ncbi:hypothetical protein [Caldanaerobacter subterraneus]|uniref:hypothetical protein n=1 Tax=Caldanaerobacter subterraneus TaxID=911092 RepID=UPI001478F6B1|nr:hypothetical protein [Caldanaerobacter subterraneus]
MPLFDEIQQWLYSPLYWLIDHLKLDAWWNSIKPLLISIFYHIKTLDFNFIIFRIVAPVAFIILIWTYVVEWIDNKDKIITYTKDIDSNLKELVKNVDKDILNDINMKKFTIGKYELMAGQKAVIVTNWHEQYSGTILGMNNVGVIYLLLDEKDGDIFALDIRAIKMLNLV